MDEFNEQIKRTLKQNISEFNTELEYSALRDLYKKNFERIESLIQRFGNKGAIEDISHIDNKMTQQVVNHSLLLREINKAISTGILNLTEIK